jgi:spermidine synthase
MSKLFEELDYCPTPIGPISLRRRREPVTGTDIFEVKLGDEHLMSTLFTASEIALGALGVAACDGDRLDIVVGGLGLGYTAQAVLVDSRVQELLVVEFLAPVLEWHRGGLVPLGNELTADPRCRFIEGDFFALAASGIGFDPEIARRCFDAILVDIDHSPDAILDDRSSSFYRPEGLERLKAHLKPGGIFGLWSNDPPDDRFTARLTEIFATAWAEPVTFDNPLMGNTITQTVYLARAAK